jgi:hypothetical protein
MRTTGWMKPSMTAALRARPKARLSRPLIPCMRAAAPNARSKQTAKRSVTRVNDQANEDQKELDPNARLEKRPFADDFRIADAGPLRT